MKNTDDRAVASTSTHHLVQQQILLTVGVSSMYGVLPSAFTAGSGKQLKRKDIDLIALPCPKERGLLSLSCQLWVTGSPCYACVSFT